MTRGSKVFRDFGYEQPCKNCGVIFKNVGINFGNCSAKCQIESDHRAQFLRNNATLIDALTYALSDKSPFLAGLEEIESSISKK